MRVQREIILGEDGYKILQKKYYLKVLESKLNFSVLCIVKSGECRGGMRHRYIDLYMLNLFTIHIILIILA